MEGAIDVAFRIIGIFFLMLSFGVMASIIDDGNNIKGYFAVVSIIIGFAIGIIFILCGSNIMLFYSKWIAGLA